MRYQASHNKIKKKHIRVRNRQSSSQVKQPWQTSSRKKKTCRRAKSAFHLKPAGFPYGSTRVVVLPRSLLPPAGLSPTRAGLPWRGLLPASSPGGRQKPYFRAHVGPVDVWPANTGAPARSHIVAAPASTPATNAFTNVKQALTKVPSCWDLLDIIYLRSSGSVLGMHRVSIVRLLVVEGSENEKSWVLTAIGVVLYVQTKY